MFDRLNERLEEHPLLAWALLALITFLVYAGTLSNGFVYDDEHQIIQNPFILNPHLWWRIFSGSVWSFLGVAVQTNFYRPLQFFTYWVLYRLAGPNPAAFHLFQIFLYIATVWLVYQVGRELLQHNLAALLGAAIWAVHPLHVEAIAWIASMPETGFGFFYLLAFAGFLRAEKAPEHRGVGHLLAALAFLPAMFFKEMALSLPLLLLAYWALLAPKESWKTRLVRWTPYLGTMLGYLIVRRAVLGHISYSRDLWRISSRVLGAAVGLLGEHTRLFFLPTHLNVFRVFEIGPALRSPWPWLTLALLLMTAWIRKREPLLCFLVFWWPIALIPCLDIRQLSFPLLAERFSYVPSIGPCLAISLLVFRWLPQRWGWKVSRVTLPAFLAMSLFWIVQTVRAIPNWHDNTRLAEYSLTQSPDAALLHVVRGVVLQYQHFDPDGALSEYHRALQLNAASLRPLASVTYDCYLGLGQIAYQKGQRDEAIGFFERAVHVLPGYSPAYDALGSMYFPGGEYAKATEYFAQAVRVDPQDLGARFYLGTCYRKLGKYREAAEQFHAARVVDPTYSQAYEAEALALEGAGDAAEAARVRSLMPAAE